MTSDDHCPPTNTRMYNVQWSFYEAENQFLLRERSVFAVVSFSGLFPRSLLLVYFVNPPKNACKGRFCIFFYLHAGEQGKTCSSSYWQTSFPPWPRGKSKCLPTCPHRLTLVLGWSRTGQVQLRCWWNILHSLSWTDRSPIHPKLKSKLGVEFRKTLGSTTRPRRQTLLPSVFN